MISLARLVEQYGTQSQYYDLGKDFSAFRRMLDGADAQLKQQYEKLISAKLVGKRVRANASRGYKQFVKSYEFDVSKVTLDDYYDNFVVVAHDSTTPKPKEYFLKTGFKVQILGPATGQPSPQKGGDPRNEKSNPKPTPAPIQPQQNPDKAQSQPMSLAPAGHTPSEEPVKETKDDEGLYDAYGVDDVARDIKGWLPQILLKPDTTLRDFVKNIGWQKKIDDKTSIAMYDLKIPGNMVKPNVNQKTIENLLSQINKPDSNPSVRFDLVKLEPNEARGEWNARIKKVMTTSTPYKIS